MHASPKAMDAARLTTVAMMMKANFGEPTWRGVVIGGTSGDSYHHHEDDSDCMLVV